MKKIFLIIILVSLLLPLISLAGTYFINGIEVDFDGLVPCGGPYENPCHFCHLFVMLDTIIDFVLIYIVFPVATLLLVISGGMLLLSAGDPGKITQGRTVLSSTVIGLVIIFSAWLLISLFFSAIGVQKWTGLWSITGTADSVIERRHLLRDSDIRDRWERYELTGLPITITDGPGKGQRRIISHISGIDIHIKRPFWNLPYPDKGSEYKIGGGWFVINCPIPGPKLHIEPTKINATLVEGTYDVRTLLVTNQGTGTLSWSARSNRGWIRISPISGDTAAEETDYVTVEVTTAGLEVDTTHLGKITFVGAGKTITVSVTLTITTRPPPILHVSPREINASLVKGTDWTILGETVSVTNPGNGTLYWSATVAKGYDWISIKPTSGETIAETDRVTVEVTTAGLEVDTTHLGKITFVGAETTVTVSVTLTVTLPLPKLCVEPQAHTTTLVQGTGWTSIGAASVRNVGVGTLYWSATEEYDRIRIIGHTSGETTTERDHVPIEATTDGLTVGSHFVGRVTFVGDPPATGSPDHIRIYLIVTPQRYYLFDTRTPHAGNLGGRAGADGICAIDADRPAACLGPAWAFITVSRHDRIIDFRGGRVTDTNLAWYFADGDATPKRAADDWTDLLDRHVAIQPGEGGLDGPHFWTGHWWHSPYYMPNMTCNGWRYDGTTKEGRKGSPDKRDLGWLSVGSTLCYYHHNILCACPVIPQ